MGINFGCLPDQLSKRQDIGTTASCDDTLHLQLLPLYLYTDVQQFRQIPMVTSATLVVAFHY